MLEQWGGDEQFLSWDGKLNQGLRLFDGYRISEYLCLSTSNYDYLTG